MRTRNAKWLSNSGGFTLVELLISMTVFLIAIGAVFAAAQLATVQRSVVNSRLDQIRSGRIALEYLRRDAINAGLGYHRTGGNAPDDFARGLFAMKYDVDTERDLMTAIMAGNEINTNNRNFTEMTDEVAFVSRDLSFNNGLLVNYTSATASGSSVRINTASGGTANCRQYDVYLFESSSGTTQVIGTATSVPNTSSILLAPGSADPLGLNQAANGTGEALSMLMSSTGGGTIKRVNIVSYGVTPEGVLVRKTYGNKPGSSASEQIETRELVYNVSGFQIRYFMEDGTTVDDPALDNSGRENQIKMNSVVQIQVTITIAGDPTASSSVARSPVSLNEFISTKNLRYESS